jgi:DNA-binding beta-propeller fold protein YncE
MNSKAGRVNFITLLLFLVLSQHEGRAYQEHVPELKYRAVPDFLAVPTGSNFGEVSAVALNSKGHIFIFHRGRQSLMEFQSNGKFVRTLGEGLFDIPHGLRIDSSDNIWTTDIGNQLVLKMNPEGRVLLVLGRRGQAGESDIFSWPLFNKPSDVALNAAGEIFVSDGYGNSRVVKFDKNGNFVKTWGKKGKGPGEFDLPHTVAVDSKGRVYVGDRENNRIQIFDGDGNFLKEWTHAGAPFGLCITNDQMLYMSDGRTNRIVKLNLEGQILGAFGGRGKAPGMLAGAHWIAVGPAEEIYVAEVFNWRMQKFVKE